VRPGATRAVCSAGTGLLALRGAGRPVTGGTRGRGGKPAGAPLAATRAVVWRNFNHRSSASLQGRHAAAEHSHSPSSLAGRRAQGAASGSATDPTACRWRWRRRSDGGQEAEGNTRGSGRAARDPGGAVHQRTKGAVHHTCACLRAGRGACQRPEWPARAVAWGRIPCMRQGATWAARAALTAQARTRRRQPPCALHERAWARQPKWQAQQRACATPPCRTESRAGRGRPCPSVRPRWRMPWPPRRRALQPGVTSRAARRWSRYRTRWCDRGGGPGVAAAARQMRARRACTHNPPGARSGHRAALAGLRRAAMHALRSCIAAFPTASGGGAQLLRASPGCCTRPHNRSLQRPSCCQPQSHTTPAWHAPHP